MKAIIFILNFILIISSEAEAKVDSYIQIPSDSIELVKSMIRETREFNSYVTGGHPKISKQYQRFIFLLDKLNIDQFLELSKDTSGCLRLYAYAGLVHNHYKKVKEIEATLQSDSTIIPMAIGCGGGNVHIYAILRDFKLWYKRKFVIGLLKEQNEQKEFFYKNFVFAK